MSSLTIKTNFTPPFTFDPTAKPVGSNALMKLIRPAVYGNFPVVGEVDFEPYGTPSGWGYAVLIIVVALAIYGAYKLL